MQPQKRDIHTALFIYIASNFKHKKAASFPLSSFSPYHLQHGICHSQIPNMH